MSKQELINYNADKENYEADGFVVIKNIFNTSEIDIIREDAKYIFGLQLAAKGYGYCYTDEGDGTFKRDLYKFFKEHQETFINCGKHIQHLINLHKLSLDDKIINTLKNLGLSFPNICTRPVLYFNSQHLATKEIYYKTPAHQDFYSMGGSKDSVVVWLPLVDVNQALGALEVVIGSHKEGLVTIKGVEGFGLVEKYADKDFVSVELNKGDALFFSSFLVHRSGNNITDSIRWSAHFRYNNMEDSDFMRRNYPHPYIYKPLSKTES
jgi:ectoine hydroxylase-related dioxygenase (phytanoyl-CoA dioxygenase family)